MPSTDVRELASIFAGGIAGGLLRAGLTHLSPTAPGSWPWTTLGVNIAGAFALGYFATRLQERLPLSSYRRPLLSTGFCGAFTTFSAVQVEVVNMLDAHRYGLAAAYATVSIVAGYAALMLATAYVRRAGVLG